MRKAHPCLCLKSREAMFDMFNINGSFPEQRPFMP